jgi:UDP-N-acetylglucosamine 2-epimerase (non-hydrolysing)
MRSAKIILTDSGGIQEEAPLLGKPVLVLRNTTERPEGVEAGNAKLVGTNDSEVYSSALELLTDPEKYAQMSEVRSPYGDGYASPRIVAAVEKFLAR